MTSTVQRAVNRGRIEHCENCEGRRRRLQGHLDTFRQRSRVTHTARQDTEITISRAALPNRVRPNTSVDVSASVTNNALFIGGPDRCDSSAIGLEGIEVRLEVLVDGLRVDSATNCIAGTGFTNRYDLTWVTPQATSPRNVTVTYRAVGAQSGDLKDELTQTVRIEQGVPQTGGGNNGGGGGLFGGPLLPCFLDPNRDCSTGELAGFGGLLFAIVFITSR